MVVVDRRKLNFPAKFLEIQHRKVDDLKHLYTQFILDIRSSALQQKKNA